MQNWLTGAAIALVSAAGTLAISQTVRGPIDGGTPDVKVVRTADGKPDLNGIWQAVGSAHWNLQDHQARPGPVLELGAVLAVPAGLSVVEGNDIPYQPWAAARQKENYENWLSRDPEVKCYLPGIPRATYMPYPFQILQSADKVLVAYQFGGEAFRVIHMTAADDLDKTVDQYTLDNDAWLGRSAGRWEGNTLVVYTKGPYFRSVTLDRAGNFMSANARVEERYTPLSAYHLQYEATIVDPDTFTRAWKIRMPLYRIVDPNMQLLEFQCLPFVEEFLYGKFKKKTAAPVP